MDAVHQAGLDKHDVVNFAGPATCRSLASTACSVSEDVAMAMDACSVAAAESSSILDPVLLTLSDGQQVTASRQRLVDRSSFFARAFADDESTDHSGPTSFGSTALQPICNALAPGARALLPTILRSLGSDIDEDIFSTSSVLHVFAVAHLLGAAEMLEAVREWVAARDTRLSASLATVDAATDAASLRMAADYSLDKLCSSKMLHAAVAADAADIATALLAGCDQDAADSMVDVRDGNGRTALHVGAIHDSAAAAAILVHAGANIEALCDPLDEDEDEDMVDAAGETQPKTTARKGLRTPLHMAALHDSAEVAQLLLDARANVAACVRGASSAVTPLHEAASAGSVRVVRILAPVAAKAAAETGDQFMAALSADLSAASDVAMDSAPTATEEESAKTRKQEWSMFLDPLNAKVGVSGSTPLHAAAEGDAPGAIAALLEAKADPTVTDDQGDTAVHCAMLYGTPHAMMELASRGCSVMEENNAGELPLHLMAEFGPGDAEERQLGEPMMRRHFQRSMKTQELLIDALRHRGQLANALEHRAAGDQGNTPLHCVARWNHLGAANAVQLLVEARADMEASNEDGWTPLTVACRHGAGSGQVAAALRSLGAKEPTPEMASLAGALGGCVRPLCAAAEVKCID